MIYNIMTLEMGRDEDAWLVDRDEMGEHERLDINDWIWAAGHGEMIGYEIRINREFIIILKIRIDSKKRLGKRQSEWQGEWQG